MKKQKKTNKQKNGVRENNIKYVYWPITTKTTTLTSYQTLLYMRGP